MKNATWLLLILTTITGSSQAAITANLFGENLSVLTTNGEDCILSIDAGFIKVNGFDPDSGPLPIADVSSFSFSGDALPNRVDVSAITTADFESFGQLQISTRGGNDEIVGSNFNDFIIPGDGVDTIEAFNGGSDIYEWRRGDGTESVSNSGGSGSVRLLYQGSTGNDDFALSAVGNTLTVTENTLMESVSLENPGSLGLQMSDGEDNVQANDMSSLSWTEPINCNKGSGSFIYNGLNSNQEINVFANGAECTLQVTPFTDCSFLMNRLFSQNPNNVDITKQGEDVKIVYTLPGGTHLIRNFTDIYVSGSSNADLITVAQIGSPSLESLSIASDDGSDTVETVFLNSTEQTIEARFNGTGTDTLRVDGNGMLVIEESRKLTTDEGFGDINFRYFEVIDIQTAIAKTDELWIVE